MLPQRKIPISWSIPTNRLLEIFSILDVCSITFCCGTLLGCKGIPRENFGNCASCCGAGTSKGLPYGLTAGGEGAYCCTLLPSSRFVDNSGALCSNFELCVPTAMVELMIYCSGSHLVEFLERFLILVADCHSLFFPCSLAIVLQLTLQPSLSALLPFREKSSGAWKLSALSAKFLARLFLDNSILCAVFGTIYSFLILYTRLSALLGCYSEGK